VVQLCILYSTPAHDATMAFLHRGQVTVQGVRKCGTLGFAHWQPEECRGDTPYLYG